MAGATFSRLKNWAPEVLTNTDLNAEIDNILNNLNPSGMDDYSTSVAQMRLTTDPGEAGTESLATSLAGEIERLRFEIKEIKGGDIPYWYSAAPSSLSDLRQLIGGETSGNRISSGLTTGRSSRLNVIRPDGTNDGFHIDGTPTNFIYYIDDVQYVINDDLTLIDNLVKAPSTNNTATLDDTNLAAGSETRFIGEYGTVLNVSGMGSNILVGRTQGFKVISGPNTSYFTAYVASSTRLTNARRGGFFNSSGNALPRITLNNGDTITLMKLTWVFLTSSKTILVTYNEPTYAGTEPQSPSTGDFWYDMANRQWKRFDGTVFQVSPVIYVGQSMQDATNCVAARTADRFTAQSDLNTIDLEWASNSEIRAKNYGAQVSVFGTSLAFETFRPVWNITANLETGYTEASSTFYYLYVKETGEPVISPMAPHDLRGELRGYYHPSETWRYVGKIFNNASSNFDAQTLTVASRTRDARFFSNDFEEVGTLKAVGAAKAAPGWAIAEGASVSRFLYNELYEAGFQSIGTNYGTANAYVFNLPKTQGLFLRGYDHGAAVDPNAASRTAAQTGGATADNPGSYQGDDLASHFHTVSAVNGYSSGGGVPASTAGPANIIWNTNATGGSETRPKNLNVQYLIKVLP